MATVIEGDQKAPFSIATTPKCREGRYSFSRITPLYPGSVPYNAILSKVVSSTILWVFGMTRPEIEPRSPWPLANTLPARPIYILLNYWILLLLNASKAFGELRKRLWLNKDLSIKTKCAVYRTIVRSTLLYGAET